MAILKKGLSGAPVRRLQALLGVDIDGQFGPATEKALKAYQVDNDLNVDGIAGPDTFAHMGLHELILLKRGSKGATVKRLQEALGIAADGAFGGGTEKAVKAFQKDRGLTVDGIVGPATLAQIDLFEEVTEETVRMSKLTPEEIEEAEKEGVELKAADASGGSIWGAIKGLFD